MDWRAFEISLALAFWTIVLLIPLATLIAHCLAWRRFLGRTLAEALVALPLVLPPTVLGYYFLQGFSAQSGLGAWYTQFTGRPLAFSFEGLLLASLIFNLPFAVQPIQRAFEAIPGSIREAAWVSGLSPWSAFWRIELPLAWPGFTSALALTFAHTLGEFGVVLMVGGNIPGETRTAAIAIYDSVQAFDSVGAGRMSALLLVLSFVAITIVNMTTRRARRRRV
jgi:molybdate transport system permease protein